MNTTREHIEELIRKIPGNLDEGLVLVNDMKNNDILQNKLLQVRA